MQENNPMPVATPQVVTEQPKPNNFLVILLSVLLIISVAISGFFAFQTQKLVKELTGLRTTSAPVATTIPTAEPTTNWKSYTNKVYSFKLPIDWNTYIGVSEGKNDQIFVAPLAKTIQIKKMWESGSGFGGGPFLNMSIQMDNDIKNYVPKSDEYQKVTAKDIIVSGIASKLYVTEVLLSSPMGEPGDKLYSVQILYKNNAYNIQLFDGQYKTEFDQILSTFKFLD